MAGIATSFSRWASDRSLAFGLLLKSSEASRRDLECSEITRRNLLLHNDAGRRHYLEGPSIDAMLHSAWLYKYTYLWIQSPGHYILDKPGIYRVIEEEMQSGFFVLGHILDHGDAYYSIHHQSFIVNLVRWAALGKPIFGKAQNEKLTLHVPLRSKENFHDGHTPLWISSSGTMSSFEKQMDGWNFISHGLKHNERLAPFPPAARGRKGYLYPEEDTGYFFKLGDYRRRAREWAEAAWVTNTEELAISHVNFQGPVGTILGVASGLKLYALLHSLGFDSNTTVHYMDASQATLDFKEWLLLYWDGRNYPAAVSSWLSKQPKTARLQKDFSEARLHNGTTNLYTHFGGEDRFVETWRQFQQLEHKFSRVDLFTRDYRAVLKALTGCSSNVVVWLSNVFHSYYTHSLLSHEEGEKLFLGWVRLLRETNPEILLLCKDHYHASIAARVNEIAVDRSSPFQRELYFPPEIITWFGSELESLREVITND